jgi:hypothetical protein
MLIFFSILGFCILLHVLYQGYRENPSFATTVQGVYCILCLDPLHVSALMMASEAETCIGRGIKYNKRLEQLLRRTVFPDNLDGCLYFFIVTNPSYSLL